MNSFECEWNLLKDVFCYYLLVIMRIQIAKNVLNTAKTKLSSSPPNFVNSVDYKLKICYQQVSQNESSNKAFTLI